MVYNLIIIYGCNGMKSNCAFVSLDNYSISAVLIFFISF